MPSLRSILFPIIIIFAACVFPLEAQQRIDTTLIYTIGEVIVQEQIKAKELRSTTPLQSLNAAKLRQSGAIQVSDAAKLFSGVVIKDYGGVGGLKTISIRSLGAAHTAISYDGVAITDAQTGQIDLGKLSLDNIDIISLNSGQSDNIFQPAKLFSAAGILHINTISPSFHQKMFNAKGSLKAGSFGMINPDIRLENKWSKTISSSISFNYLTLDGNYPYINLNGDSPEKRKRINSDVESFKTEANIYGKFRNNQKAHLKIYYYNSERGLPTNILYNENAGQRLWDENFFAQATYESPINKKLSILGNAKINWAFNRYEDSSTHNTAGKTRNNYFQNEYYLSATVLYRINSHLSFSLANDGIANNMRSNITNFATPTRYSLLNALAAKYIREKFTATAHLLSTATKETVRQGVAADNRHRLSPSVSLSYQPFAGEDFRLRVFYKDIFRLPTFNDLYYETVGTRSLKPEKAMEYNVGAGWFKSPGDIFTSFSISADAFYNRVTDKIVATPGKNQAIWSMMNIGRVDVKGMETTVEASFILNKSLAFNLTGNYTYQRALDKTDKYNIPEKATYNHQIPYTPKHSGTIRVGMETAWVNINYTIMASGERFSNQYNSSEYRMEGYQEHSITLYQPFQIKNIKLMAQAEILNLLDKQYEIVRNYPMPGRQFRVCLTVNY